MLNRILNMYNVYMKKHILNPHLSMFVQLTGESAHDFALQLLGDRVTELGGNFSCYILRCESERKVCFCPLLAKTFVRGYLK